MNCTRTCGGVPGRVRGAGASARRAGSPALDSSGDRPRRANSSRPSYRLGPMIKLARLMARILVIDDDPGVRESTGRMLRGGAIPCRRSATGEEGFDLATRRRVRRHPVRHADARPLRHRRAAQAPRRARRRVVHRDDRLRHRRHGGRGDEARRGRLRAEAVLPRRAADARPFRRRSAPARTAGRSAAAADAARSARSRRSSARAARWRKSRT